MFKVGDVVKRNKDHTNTHFDVKKDDTGVIIEIIDFTSWAPNDAVQFIKIRFFKGITCDNNAANVELVEQGEN